MNRTLLDTATFAAEIIDAPDVVLEEVRAVFRGPIPSTVNVFDPPPHLVESFETTMVHGATVQVSMIVRDLVITPSTIRVVDFESSGSGSIASGGVYLAAGCYLAVRIEAPPNVREITVRLMGLELPT